MNARQFIENLVEAGFNFRVSDENKLFINPINNLSIEAKRFLQENKSEIISELRWRKLEILLMQNDELREQFQFEVAERTAIMIADGNIPEIEAVTLAEQTTAEMWKDLFSG
jgi:1,2-phenylacetyl-CoA epoxidase catalytic subunit